MNTSIFKAFLYRVTCWVLLSASFTMIGCYPFIKKEALTPGQAMVQVRFFYPLFRDDMDMDSLIQAVKSSLLYLDRIGPDHVFVYGPHNYTCRHVKEGMETLLRIISENPDGKGLNRRIRENFLVYQAAGRGGSGRVLFTGYFEPVLEAGLTRDETFRYPIYGRPGDLLTIDLSLFRDEFRGKSIVARIDDRKVLPYFSRREIETEGALIGRGLEIAWLKDPVDVDFLQIQGSGSLKLQEGGTLRVGYAAKNGRPYRSIGRYMIERGLLKKDEVSMQRIRRYLSDHPDLREEILNHDPSYVFFRDLGQGPLVGSINVPITAGRTLALDYRLFPRGALAFMVAKKPLMDQEGRIAGWERFARFVLNQDTGGAIRGAGRADLFWGSGTYAETAAGHMQHEGDLYILVKKP